MAILLILHDTAVVTHDGLIRLFYRSLDRAPNLYLSTSLTQPPHFPSSLIPYGGCKDPRKVKQILLGETDLYIPRTSGELQGADVRYQAINSSAVDGDGASNGPGAASLPLGW